MRVLPPGRVEICLGDVGQVFDLIIIELGRCFRILALRSALLTSVKCYDR